MRNNPLIPGQATRASREGVGGRIFMSVFGLVFGTIGLAILLLSLRDSLQRLATRRWAPTPCTVVESAIDNDGEQHRFNVVFEYRFNDCTYSNRHFTHKGGMRQSRIGDAQRLLDRYSPGASMTCYVNPGNPTEAIILRDLSASGIVVPILFCLPFLIFGYGLLFFVWRREKAKPAASGIPDGKRPKGAVAAPAILGVVFVAVGLGVTYMTFLGPFLQQRAARAWTPVEAVVENSRVRSHSGDDSTTYSVDITYRYHFGGRDFRGDRYHFRSGSSSGYEAKRRVVDAHPPGSLIGIYVNSADPHASVILRDMGAALYLGLLPLLFSVAGGLILGFGIRHGRRHGRLSATPAAWTLRPARRAGKPLGMLAIALFWNGILSVFVAECVGQWSKGDRPIFMTLFLIPFVAIGTGIVAGFVTEILRLFNPRIHLDMPPAPLVPGVPAVIAFRGRGRIDRLTRLTFFLVGSETSAGGRDDGERTMREFHRSVVHELDQPLLMQQGSFRLNLPPDLMRRTAGPGDRISWSLEIKGRIRHWPDIEETYPIVPQSAL